MTTKVIVKVETLHGGKAALVEALGSDGTPYSSKVLATENEEVEYYVHDSSNVRVTEVDAPTA